MKTLTLVVVLALLGTSSAALATQVGTTRMVGGGFSIGEPTGVVGKLFLGPESAVDVGLSMYRLSGYCKDGKNKFDRCNSGGSFAINADYLWQYNLLQGTWRLDWHIGAGGRVWLWSSDRDSSNLALAARMPVGFDFMPPKPDSLEVFIEFTPTFYLAPGTGLDLEGALGVRFYF